MSPIKKFSFCQSYSNRFLWVVLCLFGVLLITKGSDGKLIVSGQVATPDLFPFAVSLQLYSPNRQSRVHKCTVSLITKKTCLGASHCIYEVEEGTTNIFKIPAESFCGITGSIYQEENAVCSDIIAYFPHESYDPEVGAYDIATFIFATPVFGNSAKTIKLAAPSFELPLSTEVRVTGWGAVDTSEEFSRELRYTDTLVVDKSTCAFPEGEIDDYEMCIHSRSSGVAKGDSGGPVFTPNEKIQVGVTTYAMQPGTTNPFIAIDVRKFHDWIIDHTVGDLPEFQE